MKLNPDNLRWDNPNNICHSLRVIAELVRSGELSVTRGLVTATDDGNGTSRLTMEFR